MDNSRGNPSPFIGFRVAAAKANITDTVAPIVLAFAPQSSPLSSSSSLKTIAIGKKLVADQLPELGRRVAHAAAARG